MTIEEKLRAMEALWDDLCRHNAVQVPQWHKDILDERQRFIDEGKAEFLDWETVKQELRDRLDERWAAFLDDPSSALSLEEFQQRMKAIRA